jgi:hypothetical protein
VVYDDVPGIAQRRWRGRAKAPANQGLFAIRQVGDAGAVIAQLVPRTWTDKGWMLYGRSA